VVAVTPPQPATRDEPAVVRLVLASSSPARLSTLRQAGIEPVVVVSNVDEDAAVRAHEARYGALAPDEQTLLLARAKCEAVVTSLRAEARSQQSRALVLGCDSLLELDGEALGKPADAAEAVARWRRMRGRSGVLHTGHWLVDARDAGGTGATLGVIASATVHFARLSDAEIDAYVATGEPLRVAGAFTVDGLGGAFVTGVEGDPHTVVGLSLPVLRDLLAEVGVGWFDLAVASEEST
jgi:septum formation protein